MFMHLLKEPIISLFVQVILCTLLVACPASTKDSCFTVRFLFTKGRDMVDNHALRGHVIAIVTATEPVRCFRACQLDCRCISFNYQQSSSKDNCQLNEENKYRNFSALEFAEGWQYYDLVIDYNVRVGTEGWQYYDSVIDYTIRANKPSMGCRNGCCDNHPCPNGATCHETCDVLGKRFTCECTPRATVKFNETDKEEQLQRSKEGSGNQTMPYKFKMAARNTTAGPEFVCDGETINLCEKYSPSWKAYVTRNNMLRLSDCNLRQPIRGQELLLFVSRGNLTNYGKYGFVTVRSVKRASGCLVTLRQPIRKLRNVHVGDQSTLIAQTFPSFGNVSLRNSCNLTCNGQTGGIGGILAFKARNLCIDHTSKIDMSGKGYRGGDGGDNRGGGGQGGETFLSLPPNMGKGGDISKVKTSWSTNTDGIGGGGAGDGPEQKTGSKGGQGGYNAGGGGGDSTINPDDGAAGGGGGGHFSGGAGGGGGSGCLDEDGGEGGTAGKIGTSAGGGGQSSCPGGKGGNGGNAGNWALNRASNCYDKSAQGGNAGTSAIGGGGGDSCGRNYGGGGGGGGLQFGSTDFESRLSYGGGGGGGGGSAHKNDPNPGGRGGNGGGLVYLQLDELTLKGKILAEGQPGQCLSKKRHRSAPGGSGAGGSVVIITKKLDGNPRDKIFVSGGNPVKCAFGAGGGGGGGVGRWVVQRDGKIQTN